MTRKTTLKFGARDLGKLIKACHKGETAFIKQMLSQGVDPNVLVKSYGSRPLTPAVRGRHLSIVKFLMDSGADPNLQDTWKSMPPNGTPLEAACEKDDLEMVKLLVRRGADVNKAGDFTPLKAAASYGQSKIVRFLLEHGAKIEPSTLHLAVRAGKEESIKYLIEAGADVNYRDKDGETPLHWAAWKDSCRISELLIAAGAKVDFPTRYTKETPLHKAAQKGKLEVVRALVKAGASATLKGWKGKNAEQWARAFKHKEVAEFLRMSKSRPNARCPTAS